MKGHNLMQAIARVNRVYKDKKGGLIVDYLDIAADLKKAVALMLEKLEIVSQMIHGFEYEEYFGAEAALEEEQSSGRTIIFPHAWMMP